MNDITFMILKIVVSVAIALVTGFLIPYIRNQTNIMQNEELLAIVKIAVQAAEQTLQGGEIKKAEVVKFVSNWLNEHGIKITSEQLDNLIESAVYTLKQTKKEGK